MKFNTTVRQIDASSQSQIENRPKHFTERFYELGKYSKYGIKNGMPSLKKTCFRSLDWIPPDRVKTMHATIISQTSGKIYIYELIKLLNVDELLDDIGRWLF